MATVISGMDYLVLAEDYSDARDEIMNTKEYLFDAVYKVVLLQALYPEVDLLDPTWQSYNMNAAAAAIPTGVLTAVRALQQHVMTRGGYTDVNAYLVAEGIQVPAGFAYLSAAAGFVIDPANIA